MAPLSVSSFFVSAFLLCASSKVLALVPDFPHQTSTSDELIDPRGWTPRPTEPPDASRLFGRQNLFPNFPGDASKILVAPDNTCGYVSGLQGMRTGSLADVGRAASCFMLLRACHTNACGVIQVRPTPVEPTINASSFLRREIITAQSHVAHRARVAIYALHVWRGQISLGRRVIQRAMLGASWIFIRLSGTQDHPHLPQIWPPS